MANSQVENYPVWDGKPVTIRGTVTHEFDENGMLEDVSIDENPILSILSHLNLSDGDVIEIQIRKP